MPHILSGEKDASSQVPEEVAIADQPRDRPHAEPGGAAERDVHVRELRHPRAVELQQPGTSLVRAAGIAVVQRSEVPPDRAPDLLFLLGVVDARDRIAFEYRDGDPVPRVDYTAEEEEVWRAVWQNLAPLHERYACRSYLGCSRLLKLDRER